MSVVFAERVRIPGPRGTLAGRLEGPDGVMSGTALILNPHPLMGGRMDNPLLDAVAAALVAHDIACLRFDYAGTGESDGTPVEIRQHRVGGAGVLDQQRILVGYSFGAYAATCMVGDRPTRALGLICPTMGRHAIPGGPLGVPTEIVHGVDDFAGDDALLERWCERQAEAAPVRCTQLPGGHFLRGFEDEVARLIAEGVTR